MCFVSYLCVLFYLFKFVSFFISLLPGFFPVNKYIDILNFSTEFQKTAFASVIKPKWTSDLSKTNKLRFESIQRTVEWQTNSAVVELSTDAFDFRIGREVPDRRGRLDTRIQSTWWWSFIAATRRSSVSDYTTNRAPLRPSSVRR